MAVLQCKMCGGSLIPVDATVCECDSCGTRQTIPSAGDDKKTNLFNRANRLRMNSEFDKAAAIYEQIVAEYPQEAEAYWGLCLCNYGIEYVDDPATGTKLPTCHRTLTTSIMEDANFEQACDYADTIARKVYRDEAKAIDRIQKDILSIAANEAPYDVFICYKETAEDGGRTEDSVLAQDIYDALTAKGMKVFFSRITLEDKLGVQYEPYIFAALSSAKVMLAIGTAFEYYDAVWVKNEWSRFLSMMKTDKSKTLIPCFKGLDAFDLPNEFRGLQAQDMGKLGWMQDLVRGVLKICSYSGHTIELTPPTKIQNLLITAQNALNDHQWDYANSLYQRILSEEDANNPKALIGIVLAKYKVCSLDDIKSLYIEVQPNKPWKRNELVNSSFLSLAKEQDTQVKSKLKTWDDEWKQKSNPALQIILNKIGQSKAQLAKLSDKDDCSFILEAVRPYVDLDEANDVIRQCYTHQQRLEKIELSEHADKQYSVLFKEIQNVRTIAECNAFDQRYRPQKELFIKTEKLDLWDNLEKNYSRKKAEIESEVLSILKHANRLYKRKRYQQALNEYERVKPYANSIQMAEKCRERIEVIDKQKKTVGHFVLSVFQVSVKVFSLLSVIIYCYPKNNPGISLLVMFLTIILSVIICKKRRNGRLVLGIIANIMFMLVFVVNDTMLQKMSATTQMIIGILGAISNVVI